MQLALDSKERKTGGGLFQSEDKVPKKYNDKTELKVEVASGGNTFNFDLETKPKTK